MLKKRLIRSAVFFIPLILIFSQCLKFQKQEDPRGNNYAGSTECISCHKEISNSYLHTAHFWASQPANGQTIQGNFQKGFNEFVFNSHLKVVMAKTDSGFYQTGFEYGKKTESQRFDISFGGVKGQTYAYWLTNELFQLPISYVDNTNSWINSPGYDPNRIAFERNIGIHCMDCHASNIKQAPPDVPGFYGNGEGFVKSSLVYSIDCERCHGPGAEHVKFQKDNPEEKKAKYIIAFKSLTRSQKINMCAMCHSGGNNHMFKPAFTFKPTDKLSDYMRLFASNSPVNYKVIDVHGNQVGLLQSSKCFLSSNMDCSTCHNTHVNERDKLDLFVARCTTCHSQAAHNECKLTNKLSSVVLKNNCISCHMPAFSSKLIIAGQSGTMIHTHHIAIYPQETQKILDSFKIN